MAKTIKTYLGEVGRTLYPIDFNMGYINTSDIYVYTGTNPNIQLSYTWVNSTQIQLSEPFTTGEEFYIRRIVTRDNIVNNYEDGAILQEKNLDDSYKQALMILEEYADGYPILEGDWEILSPIKMYGDINMNGYRIRNLVQPVNSDEPVIKEQLDTLYEVLNTYASESALAGALAGGTANIGGESAGDIAAVLNKSDIRLYTGTLTQRMQAALAATGTAYVPYGVWNHDGGTVSLDDNQHIIFGGCIIIKVGTGALDFIQAYGKKNWSVTGPAVYFGSKAANPTPIEENFLKVDGSRAFHISGLIAYLCRGRGFFFRDGPTAGGVRGERGQITQCAAYECDINLEVAATATAEYLSFSNFNACAGRVGIKDGAGNTLFNGGNATDNTEINFWLVGDYANNSHGIVANMNLNHGGVYNIRCDNVTNGHTFANNHIFANELNSSSGAIFLNNCKGVVFSGGIMDCWVYNFDGLTSGKNYIQDVQMPGGYGPVELLDQASLRPKDLIVQGVRGAGAYKSGVALSDPSDFYFLGIRRAGITQSITSGVQATVVYPTIEANGDRRRAYNTGTGGLTIPIDQSGQYTISIEQHFQCASGAVAGSTFIELRINGANKRLGCATVNGGVILTCKINTDVYLAGGDVLDITCVVTGTSPVIGVGGYVSTFSVKRIG